MQSATEVDGWALQNGPYREEDTPRRATLERSLNSSGANARVTSAEGRHARTPDNRDNKARRSVVSLRGVWPRVCVCAGAGAPCLLTVSNPALTRTDT